jgi:hypothetical protein
MSTRRAIFMKVDMQEEPDPWMLEDVQLRCELAAEWMEKALAVGQDVQAAVPSVFTSDFKQNLLDLESMWKRTRAYAYHMRETNLALVMRVRREQGLTIPDSIRDEMLSVLEADNANQGQDGHITCAIDLLKKNLDGFLDQYFTVVPDGVSKGHFSLTSR